MNQIKNKTPITPLDRTKKIKSINTKNKSKYLNNVPRKDKLVSDIDKARIENDLPSLKTKKRECLRCGHVFTSVQPDNRLCGCQNGLRYGFDCIKE